MSAIPADLLPSAEALTRPKPWSDLPPDPARDEAKMSFRKRMLQLKADTINEKIPNRLLLACTHCASRIGAGESFYLLAQGATLYLVASCVSCHDEAGIDYAPHRRPFLVSEVL